MKKTKIICTIGPASGSEETLKQMVAAGMNLARINMSHGTHDTNLPYIRAVKKVREELKLPIGLIFDTKGPEIRIGTFESETGVILKDGAEFTLSTEKDISGNEKIVGCSYADLHRDVKVGDKILINDGLVELLITKIDGKNIITKVITGGKLTNRKSMFVPSVHLNIPALSEQDKTDMLFAIEEDADFIAASFINRKQDILDIRKFLDDNGGEKIKIISKIESVEGLKNSIEIIETSDAVMVARGDLGVELSLERLPAAQKQLIKEARRLNVPVITATEMLDSMIEKPRPTRAEATDVANAVYDETTAIMLSGETAVGKYPVAVVKTMCKLAEATEENINYKKRFNSIDLIAKTTDDAIAHSTCRVAFDLSAKAIVVWTLSGHTASLVSGFKPQADILGIALTKKTYNQLSLNFGVIPLLDEKLKSSDEIFVKSNEYVKLYNLAVKGEKIVVTAGYPLGKSGSTNLIKVNTVE